MSNKIKRVFVEKKELFAIEAKNLLNELRNNLHIDSLSDIKLLSRYDISGLEEKEFKRILDSLLVDHTVDNFFLEDFIIEDAATMFAVEYLPGQYDQREDSTEECIRFIVHKDEVIVKIAKVYVLFGDLSTDDIATIKKYLINPIEVREALLEKPFTLESKFESPEKVQRISGFLNMDETKLEDLTKELGLAMSVQDLLFCQKYFLEEKRDPTITEIRVLDTYWSDHCRHTTFNTIINDVNIVKHKYNKAIEEAYELYKQDRQLVYKNRTDKPISLMDIAVLGMKKMREEGKLEDLDQSEEVNACSINVVVDVDGKEEDWLVMFKNETHNHPTEMEPFGGAATCLGGAIRDPLSGRAYVYQAMRVTGGADPRTPIRETLEGKLPQRKIALGAVSGYSSYGNQIGVPAGIIKEFYHPNFVAKRMEAGALVGAVPKDWVQREVPVTGDKIILLGGRTGRDGCGGATGSSKEHTLDSMSVFSSEVQKGNALIERNIIRLFRRPEVTRMIRRCNDFGAGGVSVAIGELADGVKVNLDKVLVKYDGLDGTELAISESQERMALVIADENVEKFMEYAHEENLEATVVAEVTEEKRMVISWQGDVIVNLSRKFLDTNGVQQHTDIVVQSPVGQNYLSKLPSEVEESLDNIEKAWFNNLQRLDVCSQKGVIECFDTTIGRDTLLLPLGGKNQLTPTEGMASNIAALKDKVNTATIMTYGFNPHFAMWSPFYGGLYATVESICRAIAMGANPEQIRLSFQEFFEKMDTKENWGKPFSALLGAYLVQVMLDMPAIGGKDSMSGTFIDINVPPTLISFAVGIAKSDDVISNEFKKPGSKVVFLTTDTKKECIPDFEQLKNNFLSINKAIKEKKIISSGTVKEGGIAAAISLMCFGNKIGFKFKNIDDIKSLFMLQPASFIFEMADGVDPNDVFNDLNWIVLGETTNDKFIDINDTKINIDVAIEKWSEPLESVYPTKKLSEKEEIIETTFNNINRKKLSFGKPKVLIPLFPGTNSEYDLTRAFETAGADVDVFVIKNANVHEIKTSIKVLAEKMKDVQMITFSAGSNAAIEPDSSGKFITSVLSNNYIKEALNKFLDTDGLILGIDNGFQALVKLGLLPFGKISESFAIDPTLTYNGIGRHVSTMCRTKIVSNLSPWLSLSNIGDIHTLPFSSSEGRFYWTQEYTQKLFENGQIVAQYIDELGKATMEYPSNPSTSLMAIESMTSPDGRILGKMCHAERWVQGTMKNIPGEKEQRIFAAGVKYFL